MKSLLTALALTTGLTMSAQAADLIEVKTDRSVAEAMDALEAAVTGAGATVFARVDHAGGAAKVGLELEDTQLLIFGNPKLGTPAMLDGQTAGLDLPLRVLAYAGEDGKVHVAYHAPATLAKTHGLPSDAKYIQMMTGALDKLTSKAVASE